MSPASSPRQPNPKSAPRRRRAAAPAARKTTAAKVQAKTTTGFQAMTSGTAYFTFSPLGELIITSYELAAALRTAGGRAFVDSGSLKIGIYSGTQPTGSGASAGGRRKKTPVGLNKYSDTRTQPDSMCQCDVRC